MERRSASTEAIRAVNSSTALPSTACRICVTTLAMRPPCEDSISPLHMPRRMMLRHLMHFPTESQLGRYFLATLGISDSPLPQEFLMIRTEQILDGMDLGTQLVPNAFVVMQVVDKPRQGQF